MDETAGSSLSRIPYARARQLLLGAGLVVLLASVLILYVRRVETPEVVGTLLFIPVFIGFVFGGVRGGIVVATLASAVYIGMRWDAIEAVGFDRFGGTIISRVFAYYAFGVVGGWANKQLENSLTKLELYDQIDDATGLYNARFLVQDTDLELSRSKRYQTVFSIAIVDVPVAALDGLSRRQRDRALKELGRLLSGSVRNVDRAVHGFDGSGHRFAVVLPETGPEGARIFTDRLADRIADYLSQKGARIEAHEVARISMSYPEDGEAAVGVLRDEFAAIDRTEHPEASETV